GHQVLAQKPDLRFIGAQHLTYHEIIRHFVAELRGTRSELAALANDDLVGVKEPGKLRRNLLTTARRPLDLGFLRHISRHSKADAAKCLNALRNAVDQSHLLIEMLVK